MTQKKGAAGHVHKEERCSRQPWIESSLNIAFIYFYISQTAELRIIKGCNNNNNKKAALADLFLSQICTNRHTSVCESTVQIM